MRVLRRRNEGHWRCPRSHWNARPHRRSRARIAQWGSQAGDVGLGGGAWEFAPLRCNVVPGAYRANARRLCYWARLAGFGGAQADVVEEGLVEADRGAELTVTIEDSDAGFTTDDDCGPWTRVEAPP